MWARTGQVTSSRLTVRRSSKLGRPDTGPCRRWTNGPDGLTVRPSGIPRHRGRVRSQRRQRGHHDGHATRVRWTPRTRPDTGWTVPQRSADGQVAALPHAEQPGRMQIAGHPVARPCGHPCGPCGHRPSGAVRAADTAPDTRGPWSGHQPPGWTPAWTPRSDTPGHGCPPVQVATKRVMATGRCRPAGGRWLGAVSESSRRIRCRVRSRRTGVEEGPK
jgi:hypothetical protein